MMGRIPRGHARRDPPMCAKTIASQQRRERLTTAPGSARARWLGRIRGNGATWYALVGSLVLALLYGRLTVMHLTAGIAGGAYNGYENLWNDYWVRAALFHFHTNP